MPTYGECMCGGVKVTLGDQGDKGSAYCHCLNCKRQSGASGTLVMAIPESEIKFEGSIKKYEDRKTDSGKLLLRFFCDTCGSPIYSKSELYPEGFYVKMGLFDKIPKPTAEVYTKNRQEWEPAAIVEGCYQLKAGS